ncbi:TetR family transcriptional regulator [Arthrobacter sp. StoSoilA2]|nr:TetR family transcriptional regulator [Arthrobacter sp. StoSoilA2]
MRSDTRRNIKSLLQAVGAEIEHNPGGVSMQSAAARAGIGTATAYRYFSSLDELLEAYTLMITQELRDFSRDCTLEGADLFNAVLDRWIDLVLEHGKVLVQLRSRTGYLQRLDQGDPVIATSRTIWERPLASLLKDYGMPQTSLRQALFLHNALTDPRDILDLVEAEQLKPQDLGEYLREALVGSLKGWISAVAG